MKLLELIDITEGLLAHLSSEQGPILSAIIPSYINGEQVDVLVQARQLDDGSPSNDVRVTVRNADGVELGSQHTRVQLLGNAEEIRRALLAGAPEKMDRRVPSICDIFGTFFPVDSNSSISFEFLTNIQAIKPSGFTQKFDPGESHTLNSPDIRKHHLCGM